MADYQSIFQPYYLNGWENQPSENTPIMGEALNDYDDTLKSLESFLSNQLPMSVGYSIYPFLFSDGTLRISLLDRYGSVLSEGNIMLTSILDKAITETTSTTQPNSYAGREMVLEIGGVTEQDSTAGNQLWNGKYVTTALTTETDTFVANTTLAGNIAMPVEVGTQYTLSINGTLAVMRYAFLDSDGSTVTSLTNSSTTVVAPENAVYMKWRVNSYHAETDKIMLNEGTTALPYEQYTGGIPAPNPSYPMEIKKSVVKGIRTHHKNFFGFGKTTTDVTKELRPSSTQRLTFSTVDDNPNRVKCNFTGGGYSMGYIAIYGVDGTKDWAISFNVESNTTEYTPVVTKSGEYSDKEHLVLEFGGGNSSNKVDASQYFVLSNIQVEEGTEATEFEAYQGTEITFSQPIELYGKNGLKDVFTSKQTKRKYVSIDFDGSDDEELRQDSTYMFRIPLEQKGVAYGENQLCTRLKRGASYSAIQKTENTFGVSGVALILHIEGVTSIDELRAHLASNPMTVVYELAEETTEELPLADQIGLNSLATYDGITYVEFIYDELEPTFKGKYGTSEVGGMTLESLLTARNNELKQELANERLSALEASVVNNI